MVACRFKKAIQNRKHFGKLRILTGTNLDSLHVVHYQFKLLLLKLLRTDAVESFRAVRRLRITEYEQAGRKFWHNSEYRPVGQRQCRICRRQDVVRPFCCAGEGELKRPAGQLDRVEQPDRASG